MKRIFQFISCLGLMFFFSNAYSQENLTTSKDFLKNYRSPNFNYTFWRLSPNIRESSIDATNFKRSQFNLGLSNYINFRQQKDKSNTTIIIDSDNDLSKGNNDGVQVSNNNFYSSFTTINGVHDYFIKDKFFLSAGIESRIDFDRKLIDEWRSTNENRTWLDLGVGYGRVFSVTNAWRAQSIFNDLECNGIAVDRSHLKDLADLLTNQRNTRVFDPRLARIQFQTELYSFIQDRGVAEFNPFTAAVINDTYVYEDFRTRRSGYRVYAGLRPGSNSSINKTIDSETKMSNLFLEPIVQFDYYLPISEDWQFDVESNINFRSLINRDVSKNLSSNVNVSLAWIPNRRIRSTTSLRYQGSYEDLFEFTDISLGYQLNYYFSPRTSILFSAILNSRWTELNLEKSTDLSQRISLGLNYQIF